MTLRRSLAARLPTIAFGGLVGVAAAVVAPTREAADAKALAAMLGDAAGVVVDPMDVRWEPSHGAVSDLLEGRFALFLGSASAGGPRDLYRARVAIVPEGTAVGTFGVANLTSTPLGDDHALVVRGARAAFATTAFGQVQSVTALDLAGEGAQNVTRELHDRAMAWVTNLQTTGDGAGVGRVDVTLDKPASRVGLSLGDGTLEVALADDDRAATATRTARLDLAKGELVVAPTGMHAEAATHLPKRFVFWAVDTVRALSFVGPAPIAWLEERTFAVRDVVKQTLFRARGGGEALAAAEPPVAKEASRTAFAALDGAPGAEEASSFPPPSVASIWKTPEPGEGAWEAPKQPWIKRLPRYEGQPEPPPPFVTTFVRPDEERPYAKVLLVAMDMRQLELGMEAGSEDPKPLVGPPGRGRIPREPRVYKRLAAAFNGGFKTEHGSYGMMVDKRVLLPPVPGAATVLITKDARTFMGSWGTDKDVGGIPGVPADDVLSFRQNLDPLVDLGEVNPTKRGLWGFTLPGTSMQTERSGLCVTGAGHLMYVWGDDVSATTLGKAMKMAGCAYGMHLDMNPHHTGLIFTNVTELKGRNYKSELLSRDMEIQPDRYIEYAPKDFFYVMLREGGPPETAGYTWTADPGVQPAPAWIPALYKGVPESSGVELFTVEPGRARFRIRRGGKEPDARTGVSDARELAESDRKGVLFALSMGVSTEKHPAGLVVDGKVSLPTSDADGRALLVADDTGALAIVPVTGTLAGIRGDAAELPLLFDDATKHTARGAAHAHGLALAALGTGPSGRVIVAQGTTASTPDQLEASLRAAGCTSAVLLDRGAGARGTMYRAGTSAPPRTKHDDTVVYALGMPVTPRAFRFESDHPVPPPAPPARKK